MLMSKPKLLAVLDNRTVDSTYTRLNNPVTVVRDHTSLQVQESIELSDKSILTFEAPCDCTKIDTMVVNGTTYQLTDALGDNISTIGSVFAEGSTVSVVVDTTKCTAYLMNASSVKANAVFRKWVD